MANKDISKVFPYRYTNTLDWKPHGYELQVYSNILDVIGRTPLVRLNRIPKDHGLECEIYVKCEYMNPGGSIKDRIGYTMVQAEKDSGRSRIQPGVTRFVVPTSGNTGIGVALTAAVEGYKCTIVTPDKNSNEKMNTIRLLGSEVIETPASAHEGDPDYFMTVAHRIVDSDPNAILIDQYADHANPMTHYEFTAEEVLNALGQVDMAVMGIGTGGTLSGIGYKFKEQCPNCKIVAVDPVGSTMLEGKTYKPFLVEGIGGDFLPEVLDKSIIDKVERPNDYESFNMSREANLKEGLLCGGSSGAALYGAIKAAKEYGLGADKRVVVWLPDSIRNYMTKFVTDQWMEALLFKPVPENKNAVWWNHSVNRLSIDGSVPKVSTEETCKNALMAMGHKHDVALVVNSDGNLVGAVSTRNLRKAASDPHSEVPFDFKSPVKKHLMRQYYKIPDNVEGATVGLVTRALDIKEFVVIVNKIDADNYKPKGIVTQETVLNYITAHSSD